MGTYLLRHRHAPHECRIAFAAWKGHDSPLRGTPALSSCQLGNHELWWTVQANDSAQALALLPHYLAERTHAAEVTEITVP
jgi:hypothetical protein